MHCEICIIYRRTVFGLIFADHNYQISEEELATCSIDLPRTPGLSMKPNQPTNLDGESLPNDEAVPDEAGAGPILTPLSVQTIEKTADMSTEASPPGCMTELNSLPVRSQEQSQANKKDFPSLVQILWPPFYNTPIAETRDIAAASRQAILQVAATILAEHGLSDTTFPMESLCVGHGDSWYDMLKYDHDDIGYLLDGILISEKVLRIKCVYAMKR
jgi:hypothetical protein